MREATIWPEHGIFGGNAALVAGTLHKHTLPVDISRREDMRYIALQVVVDRDITAFGYHASGGQVKRIYIARPASRKEDCAYGQAGWTPPLEAAHTEAAIGLFQGLGLGTRNDSQPLLA